MEKPVHPCKSCLGYSWGHGGYVPASGSGDNGVLIVAEAAGEQEAASATPLVGTAGQYLWSQLARVGIERDGFRVHNALSCRPPNNKLAGMSYEISVINHCAPLLDATIDDHVRQAKAAGKTPVILTLGRVAFKRIMGLDDRSPLLKKGGYLSYPFWNQIYGCWVIATHHPSYLMRGYHHLVPVLQFAAHRAVEIASQGIDIDKHQYLEDPVPEVFNAWIQGYLKALDHDPLNTFLSYDIETPMKQGEDEEEVAKEEDLDYTILRCSFSYRPNESVSVPWAASYIPAMEELFGADGYKVGWNLAYDSPRVRAAGLTINGTEIDAMLAWHVLNTSMPKGLGFVTPFYAQNTLMWKHLSGDRPAFYNAKDADMALRCWLGIRENLKTNQLSKVFDRHVVKVDEVFGYMSRQGVPLDLEMRQDAETRLSAALDGIERGMESAIPEAARKFKVYKKTPKETDGLVNQRVMGTVFRCVRCGAESPKAVHFKPVGKKAAKEGQVNHCEGAVKIASKEEITLWAKPLPFKVSKVSLMQYQKALRHNAIVDRREGKITFDEKAIIRLEKKYPNDPLYPLILDFRGKQKLLSTYVGVTVGDGRVRGGMPVGRDGRIHALFTHNPSTLRSACQNPNLQNLPRAKGIDDFATIIRNLIVASEGHVFLARDYSGIEAVLVGYFALAPGYIRLAKVDVHSFYTAYALHQLDGRISANDLPLLSWDDDKLHRRLAEIKKEFKSERNSLYKHLVHGANFMQGPMGAREKIMLETGVAFPVETVKRVMDIYFELFPEIKKWHQSVMLQAEKDGFLRNPFGYIHRFAKVFEYEKVGGKWQKEPGPEANKVIAFLPQSTAAGIIKEAMLRLYFQRFDEAGQYLRLLVHDELFLEVPEALLPQIELVLTEEMEKPIMEMPLPSSYGMGKHLVILTEGKKGKRWGGMR